MCVCVCGFDIQTKYLFFILMLIHLSRSKLGLLMYGSLIVPNSGDNVLATFSDIIWVGGDPMLERIGIGEYLICDFWEDRKF